jgi:hypothetical protein
MMDREAHPMIRSGLGVIVGAVLWMAAFWTLSIALAQLWPGYAIHGRQWLHEGLFTFTAPMASCNLVFWALAGIVGGWVAAKIATRPAAVWVLGGLLGGYLAVVHLLLYWPHFPWWYNLGVVLPAVPAVLLGARLAHARRSASREQR